MHAMAAVLVPAGTGGIAQRVNELLAPLAQPPDGPIENVPCDCTRPDAAHTHARAVASASHGTSR